MSRTKRVAESPNREGFLDVTIEIESDFGYMTGGVAHWRVIADGLRVAAATRPDTSEAAEWLANADFMDDLTAELSESALTGQTGC